MIFRRSFCNNNVRSASGTQLRMTRPVASVRGSELLLKDEVYSIIGCAIEVLNGIGHGLHEKPYENALTVEFKLRGIPFTQQPRFPINYKTVTVGEYVPDLIAYNALVLDTKVIEAITDHERGQHQDQRGHRERANGHEAPDLHLRSKCIVG